MAQDQKPREIKIGKYKILVDEDDYYFLVKYTWHIKKDRQTFYAATNFYLNGKKTTILMHRLICGFRKMSIDHKNRNGLDNRRKNLRYCSASQNSMNQIRNNKFGFRGVFRPMGSSNYAFQIQANGKRITRYGFFSPEHAAKEYDKVSKELHGEFGIRNFED
jgi:hypothetical protein